MRREMPDEYVILSCSSHNKIFPNKWLVFTSDYEIGVIYGDSKGNMSYYQQYVHDFDYKWIDFCFAIANEQYYKAQKIYDIIEDNHKKDLEDILGEWMNIVKIIEEKNR